MRIVTFFILVVLLTELSFSQTITVHKNDQTTVSFSLSQIDSITFSFQPGTIPTQGLVAYYPFNGNANDESGNGHQGVAYGATLTTDRFGNQNRAYHFNGTSDSIALSNTSSLNFSSGGFTLSAWANFSGNLTDGLIVAKHVVGTSNNNGLFISVWHNQFAFYLKEPRLTTPLTYSDNAWHHLVGVYDGTAQYIYVDGFLKASLGESGPISNVVSMKIGSGSGPLSPLALFRGMIDDVRIYSRALSQSEIQQLYHEGGW